ncbi:MAG TPA: rhomboid family intramembrane serine protease [Kofleriaceae bacterium]|nr:rhomboid family intramembrane serine protease [Kofleriaceae bacterium]
MDDAGGPARFIPWVTIVLAVANVAVFAWELAAGAGVVQPTPTWMLEHGGNFGPVTLDGEQWRLFTSMFLHYGAIHIAMNLIGLVDGGRHVERMYGPVGFAALYLVAGLAGSLASALRGGAISAGASGAVFGVFGAFGAFLLLHRQRLDRAEVSKQARGLLIFLAYNMLFGFTTPGIDMAAHVGGLLAGFAVGLALEVGTGEDPSTVRRSLMVAAAGIALVVVGALLAPRPASDLAETRNVEALERTVVGRWQEVAAQFDAGTLAAPQLADVIEKELLPPWRKVHAGFRKYIEGELRPLALEYVSARQEGWELMVPALRSGDDAQFQKALQRLKEADAAVQKLNARK